MNQQMITNLRTLYCHDHKLSFCYEKMYRRKRRKYTRLSVAGVAMTTFGGILGGLTVEPWLPGVFAGIAVILQAYVKYSEMEARFSKCKVAYKSCNNIMDKIRSILIRTSTYKHDVFAEFITANEQQINACKFPIPGNILRKYQKLYPKNKDVLAQNVYNTTNPIDV